MIYNLGNLNTDTGQEKKISNVKTHITSPIHEDICYWLSAALGFIFDYEHDAVMRYDTEQV